MPATIGVYVSGHRELLYLTPSQLNGNPLPIDVGHADAWTNSRAKLPEILAATSHLLAVIREPAFVILAALQPLFIPALLLVDILDEAFPNSIPMH
ncbi:MAG: hypothetical protein IV100_04450, partial [Myxococcales bacterium]|nr:hypothetical protein [Myxococcales bacterium]